MATPFRKPGDTLPLVDGWIQNLGDRYELENSAAVEIFLRSNDFLIDVLLKAHEKIMGRFGTGARASLKVVEEPESKNARRLFILIRTDLRPREAMARLDKLDEDWWLGALPAARGKLSIDVEYG